MSNTPSAADASVQGLPQGTRVALVDDDPQILEALSQWLSMMGLQPCAFANAETLLDAMRQPEVQALGPLAGAILDINLGGLNGVRLAHRLRLSYPNIPIVMITALDADEIALLGDLPARAVCLRKPFDLGALEDAMFNWIH